jgi:hypothetical protein
MEPFELEITWTAWSAYDDALVDVVLHRAGHEPVCLRSFASPELAVAWSVRWFEGRGISFACWPSWHEERGHTYLVMQTHVGMHGGTERWT